MLVLKQKVPINRVGEKDSLNASKIHSVWSPLDNAQVLLELNCHHKQIRLFIITQNQLGRHVQKNVLQHALSLPFPFCHWITILELKPLKK